MEDEDNKTPEGINKTNEDKTLNDIYEFFSSDKIDPSKKDSVLKYGGIIGSCSVYITDTIEEIFKESEKESKKEGKQNNKLRGLGLDIGKLGVGAGIALSAVSAGLASAGSQFSSEVSGAIRDSNVAYWQSVAKAYQTPTFISGMSYVLVGSSAIKQVISDTLTSIGSALTGIGTEFTPEVFNAHSKSQVSYWEAISLAYKEKPFIEGMSYVLIGSSAIKQLVADTLTSIGSALTGVGTEFTREVFKAHSKSQVSYWESIALAYKERPFIEGMSYALVGSSVLGDVVNKTITAVGSGIAGIVLNVFDPDIISKNKESVLAYYDAIIFAYQSDEFKESLLDALKVTSAIKEGLDATLTGLGAGIGGFISEGLDKIGDGISNVIGDIGKGISDFYKSAFDTKLKEAQTNILLDAYSNPNNNMKTLAYEFAEKGLKAYVDGFDVDSFLNNNTGWFSGQWKKLFGKDENDAIIKAQKKFVENTCNYLAEQAKDGKALATNEFYQNKGMSLEGERKTNVSYTKTYSNGKDFKYINDQEWLAEDFLSQILNVMNRWYDLYSNRDFSTPPVINNVNNSTYNIPSQPMNLEVFR